MHGYKKVILYKNNKRYHKSVHRLVAIAFIPNKDKVAKDNTDSTTWNEWDTNT